MVRTALALVLTLSLVVTLAACQSGAGQTPDPEPGLIATVELDAYGIFPRPTEAGPIFEEGEPYRITVQGTFSVWGLSAATGEGCKGVEVSAPMFPSPERANGPVFFDARYQFATLAWDPACAEETELPFVAGVFRVSLDGGETFAALIPAGADGFDSEHQSTYDVIGSGEAVRFQIADPDASDNYGVLKIEVYGFE